MRRNQYAWMIWVWAICASAGLLSLAWARWHKQEAKSAAKKAIKAFFAQTNSVPTPKAQLLATLESKKIGESSGLAVGRRNPAVLWTHNDSGDDAELYAIDRKGRLLARFRVPNAKNEDWEDLAAGPGVNGTPALYIGDTGDNSVGRNDTVVYRVEEPTVDTRQTKQEGRTAPAERFPYRYPDGAHDCETVMVHPQTGEIYLVTKEESGASGVYVFPMPLQPGRRVTLRKVGTVQFHNTFLSGGGRFAKGERQATGGDIAPNGRYLVIRTYLSAFEWKIAPGQPLAEAFKAAPRQLILPLTKQGESICYTADSKSWLMTSEQLPTPLYLLPVH